MFSNHPFAKYCWFYQCERHKAIENKKSQLPDQSMFDRKSRTPFLRFKRFAPAKLNTYNHFFFNIYKQIELLKRPILCVALSLSVSLFCILFLASIFSNYSLRRGHNHVIGVAYIAFIHELFQFDSSNLKLHN